MGSRRRNRAALSTRDTRNFSDPRSSKFPATAAILRAVHQFQDELKEALGAMVLYNEALGTTSDRYVYDRVVGRP